MITNRQRFRRLTAIAAAAVAVVLGMLLVPSATAGSGTYVHPAGERLRDLADQQGLVRAGVPNQPAPQPTVVANEFNALTTSRDFKWSIVEPVQGGGRDYSLAEDIVEYTQQHDMKLNANNLVYQHSNPDWLSGLTT